MKEIERLEAERDQYFRWAYQLLLALAKRNLKDSHTDEDAWPGRMEWNEMVPSSQSIFLHRARDEAGVPHEEFLKPIREGIISVDDLYDKANAKA